MQMNYILLRSQAKDSLFRVFFENVRMNNNPSNIILLNYFFYLICIFDILFLIFDSLKETYGGKTINHLNMAELKTKRTKASVEKYINSLKDDILIADCNKIIAIMKSVAKCEPKMWGPAIVGFGDLRYKYASGREGDWFRVGFAPRKGQISLYVMGAVGNTELLSKLGKHKAGKGCLYIRKLSDVDENVLKRIIKYSNDNVEKLLCGC